MPGLANKNTTQDGQVNTARVIQLFSGSSSSVKLQNSVKDDQKFEKVMGFC